MGFSSKAKLAGRLEAIIPGAAIKGVGMREMKRGQGALSYYDIDNNTIMW
jgi:hypothetical protein